MIRCRDVSRSFALGRGTLAALGPMDLDVAAADFACVVGPSGCGKSTLLRIVAGLLNPSTGVVELAAGGIDRLATATVFQDGAIYPWKTVIANVRLGLDLAGVPRPEGDRRAGEWIARLGLREFASAYPAVLSGGMRQRVAIARALVVEPEILLMDEPFAALDAQLRLLLQEELLDIWERDRRTVVFVTHSVEEAILLGNRVIVLSARPGRVIGDFAVPFDRPRSHSLRTSPEFGELEAAIWALLRREIAGAVPVPAPAR